MYKLAVKTDSCVCSAIQMIANNPLLAGNPELQQQMVQMLPTMLERVRCSCFMYSSLGRC